MPKTQEELTQLKEEYETLNNKLKELSGNELKMVTGGGPKSPPIPPLPAPAKDNRVMGSTKYRCKDCGNEYICTAGCVDVFADGRLGNSFYGDDVGCCPKCGSINRETLARFR